MGIKRNMKIVIFFFAIIFAATLLYFAYSVTTYGQRWFASPYNVRIALSRSTITTGSIIDAQGVTLASSSGGVRIYSDDELVRLSTSHIVGDVHGMTQGAELMFARYLCGFNSNSAVSLKGIFSPIERGSDVRLTVSSALSAAAYDALGEFSGAVVVLNYETGEILACVSKPGFNPSDANEQDEEGVLFSRATQGTYPPGSIFKIVTTAALLENGMESFTYQCTGEIDMDGGTISCAGGTAHGEVNLEKAFCVSCNSYFAAASAALGGRTLLNEAERFKFNTNFIFGDIIVYESIFKQATGSFGVAQSGIGQYDDTITPIHAAMISATVANGGVMMQPKLLFSVIKDGTEIKALSSEGERILSNETAKKISELMAEAVNSGTGKNARVSGATVYGKTGTAQYQSGDKVNEHAWFVGYMDKNHPLAIAVLVEGGGGGGSIAAPIAAKVFSKALSLGY